MVHPVNEYFESEKIKDKGRTSLQLVFSLAGHNKQTQFSCQDKQDWQY